MCATINKLLEQAIAVVQNVPASSHFFVKDLFDEQYWNSIPARNRRLLGKRFLEYAKDDINNIEILGKTSGNHQKYRKR